MSTIITRSALVAWGHNPAPDVARIEVDHRQGRRVVTWADVMRARREHQAWILARKRETHPVRAYRLWVAYFDQDLFGGWHAFLGDFRGRRGEVWIDRGRSCADFGLLPRLMRLYPVGEPMLPLGTPHERWERWKVAFARRYRRGEQCGQPRGCVYLWWDGRGEPRRIGGAR